MIPLVHNEMLKMIRKRRFTAIAWIIAALTLLFSYAEKKELDTLYERLGSDDWRTALQTKIVDAQNRLNSPSLPAKTKKNLRLLIRQQQYYLERDINPHAPGAPGFMRLLLDDSIHLFIPLLVVVVASDLVASEAGSGTLKLLLTRPVKRWKVLAGKYIALLLSVSFILLLMGGLSCLLSGFFFGFGGWQNPVLTGFRPAGEDLDVSNVHLLPLWRYLLFQFGFAWFAGTAVGSMTLMFSVLFKSTPLVIGIMVAFLTSGATLSNMVSSWPSAKYLFMINLQLANYLNGRMPPVEGMTLSFSLAVLALWAAAALAVSFMIFTKKDIY